MFFFSELGPYKYVKRLMKQSTKPLYNSPASSTHRHLVINGKRRHKPDSNDSRVFPRAETLHNNLLPFYLFLGEKKTQSIVGNQQDAWHVKQFDHVNSVTQNEIS